MSDMPSWVPPQAPTYTSNCTALSEAELVERVAQKIFENDDPGSYRIAVIHARIAIAVLREAGAMK